MKTKNPAFIKIYNGTWEGPHGLCRWNSSAWTHAFADGAKKLPSNTETINVVLINGDTAVNVVLYGIGRKGTRKHRAYVRCDRCLDMVPAGRIHQHKC